MKKKRTDERGKGRKDKSGQEQKGENQGPTDVPGGENLISPIAKMKKAEGLVKSPRIVVKHPEVTSPKEATTMKKA